MRAACRGWLQALLIPGASSLVAASALGYALLTTGPDSGPHAPHTPERLAQDFAAAYQARDFDAAASLASGDLRRTLESRARSARLQGTRTSAARARQLVIEECFMLPERRLRFVGVLAERDTPDAQGWPISITVAHKADGYLAEALQWPKGPPPDER